MIQVLRSYDSCTSFFVSFSPFVPSLLNTSSAFISSRGRPKLSRVPSLINRITSPFYFSRPISLLPTMSWALRFIGVLFVVLLVKKVARCIEIKRFKQQHGCKPPTYLPQSERIIGWKLYKSQMKASREHKLLQAGRERYLNFGNTLSLTLMGKEFINVSLLPLRQSQAETLGHISFLY